MFRMNRRYRSALSSTGLLGMVAAIGLYAKDPGGAEGGAGDPPAGGGGGGSGGGSGGGGGGDPPANPHLKEAIKARDAAKARLNGLLKMIGIPREDVEFVETGDPENPLEIRGLDGIIEAVKNRQAAQPPKKWEDREKELQAGHQKAIQKAAEASGKLQGALTAEIRELAVTNPLRAACAAEGAFDHEASNSDRAGLYGDIVALLAPRIKTEVKVDEDTGKVSVSHTCLSESNQPLLDGKGNPVTIRGLVAKFLADRPNFRAHRAGGGPGAGGFGGENGQGGGATPATHAKKAIRDVFDMGSK